MDELANRACAIDATTPEPGNQLDQVADKLKPVRSNHSPDCRYTIYTTRMVAILSFPLYGPSRRADIPVVEVRLDPRDPQFPPQCPTAEQVMARIKKLPMANKFKRLEVECVSGPEPVRFAELLGQLALELQRIAGHRVDFLRVRKRRYCEAQLLVLVEHAHAEVGTAAVQLAVLLLSPQHAAFAEQFARFDAFARQHVIPNFSRALTKTARRRDIPVLYLARPPLDRLIRVPGHRGGPDLVQLGQGARHHVLEGTFDLTAADSELHILRENPGQLESLFSPVKRGSGSRKTRIRLIGVGRSLCLAVQLGDAQWQPINSLHAFWAERMATLLERTRGQVIMVEAFVDELDHPPDANNSHLIGISLGPDIEFLCQATDHDLPSVVAEAVLDALFPEPGAARIKVVSITGTNGKTTTTRMIAHILRHAGLKTGMVTSEGVHIEGQQLSQGDSGSFMGHTRVLCDRRIEAAALETHHRGIVIRGFAFDHCDVGICLNVSPDHIARGEIETMAEMEDVKAAVPERASKAAILFADDDHCRAMADRMKPVTLWWVSLKHSVEDLAAWPGIAQRNYCTVEQHNDEEWIVLHQKNHATRLMRTSDIPATMDGAARFMLSNAMHAAAASVSVGVAPETITSALAGFKADFDMAPGRLNEFHDLPFRLICDFAHNPDGIAKLSEFTDRLEIEGRKLIALSGMGKRDDSVNRMAAESAAGHYDHYFCKDYTPSQPPLRRALAPFMQQCLIEAGVERDRTTLMGYGKEVLFDIFDACKPGDLLIYLIGNAEKNVIHDHITEYRQTRLPTASTHD